VLVCTHLRRFILSAGDLGRHGVVAAAELGHHRVAAIAGDVAVNRCLIGALGQGQQGDRHRTGGVEGERHRAGGVEDDGHSDADYFGEGAIGSVRRFGTVRAASVVLLTRRASSHAAKSPRR